MAAFEMGFLGFNPETMTVWLDRRACELFELDPTRPEVEFEYLRGRIHPDDRERVETAMERLLSDGGACEKEFRVSDEAGAERRLSCICQLYEEPGEPRRILCLCSDISGRSRLADQRMGDFLHAAEHERSFIGATIHDTVCQDLRAIGLMSETLLHKVSTSGTTLEETVGEVEAMRRVLSEATERAIKLARGISPLSIKNQTLRQALAALLDGFTGLYPHIRFEFEASGPHEEDQQVIDQLYCVAQEAIRNAIHPESA